ncbi:MAG: nuclear transport factor 2 family protein [Reichenbachiella sp.]
MKKTMFIVPLLVGLLINCSQKGPNDDANVALINTYIKAVESNDVEKMADLLAENYIGIGPSVSDTTNKATAIENWKINSEVLYESIKYSKSRVFPITVKEGDYPGEWVSNFAYLKVNYKNGDAVQLLTNTSYRIENGKIVNSFTFYNEADALEQLNYVFLDLDEITLPEYE